MAKDMKKESKGKSKKPASSGAAPSTSVGQTVSNAPAGKSRTNVKPQSGSKR